MVLRVIASESAENLVPLSIPVSLIFGLWAIRAVQPGVPAVGAFVDYVAFLWAEIIVGVSAVIVACTWLLGSQKRSAPLRQSGRQRSVEHLAVFAACSNLQPSWPSSSNIPLRVSRAFMSERRVNAHSRT
jgi:hypothetical protein